MQISGRSDSTDNDLFGHDFLSDLVCKNT